MSYLISSAIIGSLILSLFIVLRWSGKILTGDMPTGLFAFIAILFTSGLDVGLIMFPLTEFPIYAAEANYEFTNPLAMAFGAWGFLVWALYFLTTFYFCVVEPKLKLFQIPAVKFVNNIVIIGTCAFTGFLFLSYLPDYISGITDMQRFILVGIVVLFAVLSSTDVRYVKILSLSSTWLFYVLIAAMWIASGIGLSGMTSNLALLADYFPNIHKFAMPVSDYHQFYLFWWMAWSIMIGQFVARFVGGLKTWQLLLALLVLPSIPLALWFSVLYGYYAGNIDISPIMNIFMIVVGIVFVINSLDSLTRLYTDNLNISVKRFGLAKYVGLNWAALFGLVLLYQFTPLEIEWVGLIVIGLYCVVAALTFQNQTKLRDA